MSRPNILQAAIDAGCSNPPGHSWLHGEHHWKCVAEVGLYIAGRMDDQQAIDRDFITTFALLHDVERTNDGKDFNHGLRAGLLFQRLVECGQLRPGWDMYQTGRVYAMHYALRLHCQENVPYVGSKLATLNVSICWDADRLCRYRLHETPSNDYLTTKQARGRAAHLYASRRCADSHKASWTDILGYPSSTTALST